jgi:hypothetical protein
MVKLRIDIMSKEVLEFDIPKNTNLSFSISAIVQYRQKQQRATKQVKKNNFPIPEIYT